MSDATFYDKAEFLQHFGERLLECDMCGTYFAESNLIIRNGKRVCTIADFKSSPCLDERGHGEVVRTAPLTPPTTRKKRFLAR